MKELNRLMGQCPQNIWAPGKKCSKCFRPRLFPLGAPSSDLISFMRGTALSKACLRAPSGAWDDACARLAYRCVSVAQHVQHRFSLIVETPGPTYTGWSEARQTIVYEQTTEEPEPL